MLKRMRIFLAVIVMMVAASVNAQVTTSTLSGKVVDANGNNVTVKGEDGTVYVQGNSGITVTVSSYSTEDKSADALQTPSYSDYEVAEPDED